MPGLPLPPEWADWAPRQLSRLGSVSAFPLSINEARWAEKTWRASVLAHSLTSSLGSHAALCACVCVDDAVPLLTLACCISSLVQAAQLDESQFRAYMQYLQRGLLADCGPPPDLETAHQLFQRMALVDGVGAGGVRQGGSAGSGARHALQREADRQQQQQQQQEQLQEHRAQQEQPPSHAYPFFGASVWHKHRGMLPADYVLLLTPCAALVWLVPEALHEVGRW